MNIITSQFRVFDTNNGMQFLIISLPWLPWFATLTANTTDAECHPDDTATETKTSLQCYKTPLQCQNSCGRSFAVTRLLNQEVGFDSLPGVKCSIGCRKILFYSFTKMNVRIAKKDPASSSKCCLENSGTPEILPSTFRQFPRSSKIIQV